MKISMFLFVGVIGAAGCVQAEERGRQGHHHDFPEPVVAFHDVMAPIWHSPSGAKRITAICRDVPRLQQLAGNIVQASVPAEVDAEAWQHSARELSAGVDRVGSTCEQGDDVEAVFGGLHDAFHDLVRHVGHRH